MKKELITHFSFFIAFFIFISLFRGWFKIEFLPFWVGGLLGTLIIDLDHLVYVYLLRPHELTSKRVSSLFGKRKIWRTFEVLAMTRSERKGLMFHTVHFQVLFIIFSFLIITSSGSILGRGLVIAALLHLLIDQVVDYLELGSVEHWFSEIPFKIEKEQTVWYMVLVGVSLLAFGFLF